MFWICNGAYLLQVCVHLALTILEILISRQRYAMGSQLQYSNANAKHRHSEIWHRTQC